MKNVNHVFARPCFDMYLHGCTVLHKGLLLASCKGGEVHIADDGLGQLIIVMQRALNGYL